MRPVVFVNLKAYAEGTDKSALLLVEIVSKLSKEGADIRIVCQASDIRLLCDRGVPIYAQHCDPITPGAHTGWLTASSLMAAGAVGTLLNHSEHRVRPDVLSDTVKFCKKIGFRVVCCAKDADTAKIVSSLKPEFVAVEPPELIGGEISVSSAKPEIISDSVSLVGKNLLVGAGVKNRSDVDVAMRLGAVGILVSSHVVLSKDPEKVLRELSL